MMCGHGRRYNVDEFHASKFRPPTEDSLAFADEQKAFEHERYLKPASGRAFAKKRL
jgi:putative endonuclease